MLSADTQVPSQVPAQLETDPAAATPVVAETAAPAADAVETPSTSHAPELLPSSPPFLGVKPQADLAPATEAAPAIEAAPPVAHRQPERPRAAPVFSAAREDVSEAHSAKNQAAPARSHRFAMLAASLTLAAAIGSAAGAAGIAGASKLLAPAPAPKASTAGLSRAELNEELKGLRDSVAQMRTAVRSLTDNLGTMRAQIEARATGAQLTKVTEAIDRIERAQAEPAAKLAKATEALERIEKRPPPVAHEVTGSVNAPKPSQAAVAPIAEPAKPRVQVLDGWHVRRVINGVAIMEGRMGVVEAEVGDTIPGLGRIEDMKRQDGRWVVVTSRGVVQTR